MKDHLGPRARLVLLAAGCLLTAASAAFAQDACVYEDARITGRRVHAFADEGRLVSVVPHDLCACPSTFRRVLWVCISE